MDRELQEKLSGLELVSRSVRDTLVAALEGCGEDSLNLGAHAVGLGGEIESVRAPTSSALFLDKMRKCCKEAANKAASSMQLFRDEERR